MEKEIPTIDIVEVQKSINEALEAYIGEPLTLKNIEVVRERAQKILEDFGIGYVFDSVVDRDLEDPYKLIISFYPKRTK